MIIFINGAFGVGKTTIAEKLIERIPDSMLYDPEEVGSMLWKILKPIGVSGDFQDFAAWRPLVSSVARELQNAYKSILVIPMTIWRTDYFNEVIDGLRLVDPNLYHFCLTAPLEVTHQRLRQRAQHEEREPDAWAFQQTEKCIGAFRSSLFDERINTLNRSSDEIAEYILRRVGRSLAS